MNEQTNQQTDFANQWITKQAAIDAARDWYEGLICGSFKGLEKRLRALPSAQPEIIRCRDCKHYYYADSRIPQELMCVCDIDGDRWSPDSYCSFAERRQDDVR